MKHVVVATSGHIDHGKTELTRALTGIDTDRLPEEKARGITIDLGFAHLELAQARVALIDVPGHERFVKNMLAGVGGVDVALLVVAADESVMPQTREHLAILRLLGVPRGLVVLTKSDLVDAETLELARLEATEFVRGSFLEGAPLVAVSARTGAGMDALRAALAAEVAQVAERDAGGPFRLHVDRAFSVHGFGSVVTGTVASGRARAGDELELAPRGARVRVRGIEVHGKEAAEVAAGSRAALNLQGVELADLERGQQLLTPGLFRPTSLLDARLRLLADAPAPLKDLARVRFHLGALEALARVKLLELPRGELPRGEEALVQLRLESPVVAWPRDRFIVRSYSPAVTIGGGVVIDPLPAKHRGRASGVSAALAEAEPASPARALELRVARAGRRGVALPELVAASGRSREQVEADLGRARALVRVAATPPRWFAREAWEELETAATETLRRFHAREPLREGMSREELRARLLGEDATSARQLLDGLARAGKVRLLGEAIALAAHRVSLSDDEARAKQALEEAFRKAGLNPPTPREALEALGALRATGEKLLPVLVRERRLVSVAGGLHFHVDAIAGLKRLLAERLPAGRSFSVPEFKELTGTSRKFAIPLLEHLDAVRFTRRVGDSRVLVGGAAAAAGGRGPAAGTGGVE